MLIRALNPLIDGEPLKNSFLPFLLKPRKVASFSHLSLSTTDRVDGGSFVDASCNEYFISGVNGWLVAETGGAQYFNMMEATGLKVLRFFAHGSDPSWIIQPRPGVYDETKLRAIDAVIADAASRGLRVTISLANNWKTPDGKKQYVSWVPELHCDVARCAGSPNDDAQFECEKQACPDEDKFFSDPRVRTLYKNHIRYMLTRRNTVTGRIYGSDPTILSINLMNEPNVKSTPACWGNNDITAGQPCVDILQAWIQEMSEFAKSVAPTALITIGCDFSTLLNSTRLGRLDFAEPLESDLL